MKTYTVEMISSITVKVNAEDEETAVTLAMEEARQGIAEGKSVDEVHILNP